MSKDEPGEVKEEAQEEKKSEDPVEITIGGDQEDEDEVFSPLDFLLTVPGLGKVQANRIIMTGYKEKESITSLTEEELLRIPDMPPTMAKRIIKTINGEEEKKEEEEEEKKEEKEKEEEKEEKKEVVFKIKGEEEKKTDDEEEGDEEKEVEEPELESATEVDLEGSEEIELEVGVAATASEDKDEEDEKKVKEEEEEKEGGGLFGKIKSGISGIFKKDKDEDEDKKKEDGDKKEQEPEPKKEELELEGIEPKIMKKLSGAGYQDIDELKEAIAEDFTFIDGIDEEMAEEIYSKLHPEEE